MENFMYVMFIGTVMCSVGVFYFKKGKKDGSIVALVSSLVLFFTPFFVENLYILLGLCVVFIVTPIYIKV